jgi:hypothetical protein
MKKKVEKLSKQAGHLSDSEQEYALNRVYDIRGGLDALIRRRFYLKYPKLSYEEKIDLIIKGKAKLNKKLKPNGCGCGCGFIDQLYVFPAEVARSKAVPKLEAKLTDIQKKCQAVADLIMLGSNREETLKIIQNLDAYAEKVRKEGEKSK